MFASFSCHAESVCADILFLQQQYLLKAKNKENGLNGINGRWTLAVGTWWYWPGETVLHFTEVFARVGKCYLHFSARIWVLWCPA